MSSLASAPGGAVSGPAPATTATFATRRLLSADAAFGLVLAGSLALLALLTAGGSELAPNTWAEIALLVIGAAFALACVLLAAPGRAWGATTLALFAALAALTFLSIAWSVQPANSWIEANRTLSYLAAFGAGVALAHLAPRRWAGMVGAIAVFATIICGWALLAKVFPATFDPREILGRIVAPLQYWNADGLIAALGLPACLWAGARHRGRVLRALAVPAIGVLIPVLILSYSRSALVVAVIGLAFWFAIVPLRLRAALVLALGGLGGAVITAYALATHPLTHDLISLHSRSSAGHALGVLLVLVLGVQTVLGFGAAFVADRVELRREQQRRVGAVLIGALCLIPIGGLVALAGSSRGFTGEVSHLWSTLTSPNSVVGDKPGRLVELGSTRARYWRQGLKVGEHAVLAGTGALGFATARTRYTRDSHVVQHAHGYVIETFADFGLIGLAVSVALLVTWIVAVVRAVGTRPPPGRSEAEWIGLLTLLGVVLMFGVHSTIDWTWFVPATALPALVCAGWLAGRGPLARPSERPRARRRFASSPGAAAAALAICAAALAGAWVIWQPLRSANAEDAAIAAIGRGDAKAALADARAAAARDPVSVDPLWDLAAIYNATGDRAAAHAELVKAISLQPQNPATWKQLGEYDLQHGQPQTALGVLRRALQLDLGSSEIQAAIAQAQAELHGRSRAGGR